MRNEEFTALCKQLEHFETPIWAAKAILKKEILTHHVIDPCCGTGVLSHVAMQEGYEVFPIDIHDWGFGGSYIQDFLEMEYADLHYEDLPIHDFTIYMNPPFSKAQEFVEKAFKLGARKVVCFQRFAWWESRGRKPFWQKYPPNRIYICGDRADCWRHDIPKDERGSSSPTAHAWFVWEKGNPPGTVLGHIYKTDAEAA